MPVKSINGIKLNYRESGKGDHTVVFTHPVLFDSTVFDPLVSDLEDDFRLIILDTHGHGKSEYRAPLTLEEMTDDYHQLLINLNLSKVTWVGYSVGGMLGMRLAIQHPELFESLILIATSARLDPPKIREQTWWLWQMFRAGHREDIVDAALRFFFAPDTFSNQPALVAKYRANVLNYNQGQARGMFEVARAVLGREDISDAIKRIRVPTLAIAGKEDLAPAPAELEFIVSQIPNAQLAVVDGASHLLAIEKPAEVSHIIKKFLGARKWSWQGLGGHGEQRRTTYHQPADAIVDTRGVTPLEGSSPVHESLLKIRKRRRLQRNFHDPVAIKGEHDESRASL
jgi:3-oxoadipate enol-lactonase